MPVLPNSVFGTGQSAVKLCSWETTVVTRLLGYTLVVHHMSKPLKSSFSEYVLHALVFSYTDPCSC